MIFIAFLKRSILKIHNTLYHIYHTMFVTTFLPCKKKKFGQKIVHFSDTLDFYNNFSFLKLEN